MNGVRQRKREMVAGLIAIHQQKFAVPNFEFVLAERILVGPRTVEARLPDGSSRRFVAERLFLNLGTRATIPGVPGLADAQRLTHVEALELDRLPSHLIVLGGGYHGARRPMSSHGRDAVRLKLAHERQGVRSFQLGVAG